MSMVRNEGFTLVELMVALVIGLLIILGGGQLFLIGMQNFRQLEDLSEKQAAVTFVADVLLRNVRRADMDYPCSAVTAQLSIRVDGECHYYDLNESNGVVSLRQRIEENGWEPIVGGFSSDEQFVEVDDSMFRFTFYLQGENEPLVFHVVNRTRKISN